MVEGEVWRLPRKVVIKVLDDEPGLVQQLLSIVATRLEEAHDRLCSFAHDSVPARIARLILSTDATGEKIEMTRRALGDEAGTTVETTIRVLRSFERAGWVEGGVGWVRVLDRPALERIADGDKPAS
jgi:CRP/FNR family transcriptional regulator